MLIIVEQLQHGKENSDGSRRTTDQTNFTCRVCIRTTETCTRTTETCTNSGTQIYEDTHIHTSITDPFDDFVRFRSVWPSNSKLHRHAKEVLRYHVDESLNKTDCNDDAAHTARHILEIYHNHLAQQLLLSNFLRLADCKPIQIEVISRVSDTATQHERSSVHQLQWEVLENTWFVESELQCRVSHIALRRRLVHEDMPAGNDDATTTRVNDFNILIVIARRSIGAAVEDSDRWSPIQLLIALFKVQRDLWWRGGRRQINLEVVRPGSFDEFRSQLARTRAERGQVHAVHFDVHGDVP